ncbi:MAG: hypothetical protein HY796_05980 [Elusimicrobia bacterium]|nr:hypothetical protein [Elusimicrobiota bacterium]
MSKHKKKPQFLQNPPTAQPSPGGGPAAPVETPAPAGGAGPEIDAPTVPKTYFFLFWGLIIAAVTLAWTLAVLMPGVRESVIERWIMLALAGALAALLLIFR